MKRNRIVPNASRLAVVTVLMAVAGLALACGSSYPSESEARKVLEAQIAKDSIFKIRSFTKTNGMGDDKHYTVEFEAELECLKQSDTLLRLKLCEAGQVVKTSGEIKFEKTENGWRGKAGPLR
jgi:hypothetical protein